MAAKCRVGEFRPEQFVQVRQIEALYEVCIEDRRRRKELNGHGCTVKDCITNESRTMPISALIGMQVYSKNRKTGKSTKVKARNLTNGTTMFLRANPNRDALAFIVPAGNRYEYEADGMQLPPATVILTYDGTNKHYLNYAEFRKMFVMLPNPVSSGAAKQPGFNAPPSSRPRVGIGGQPQQGFNTQPQMPKNEFGGGQQSVNRSGVSGADAALAGLDPNVPRVQQQPQQQKATFTVVGQIYVNGQPWGYVLSDGVKTYDVAENECLKNAAKIGNVKVMSRVGGGSYLQGVGIALKSLPIKYM